MIHFIEHSEPGYALRTITNARAADLTICFGVNFKSLGMILTHKSAYGKYERFYLDGKQGDFYELARAIELHKLISSNEYNSLNIAGNGIYSLKRSQESIDVDIFTFLETITSHFGKLDLTIRSGGQTGVDEAALKAGDKLGLDCICLAPKGWMFRTIEGKDIVNEEKFLERFGDRYINNI